MTKYHISKNGKPALCKADIKACPCGGENEHYSSLEEAQKAADKKLKAEHSILALPEFGPHIKGKIWLTNGIENKTIFPNELDNLENKGWTQGRTLSEEHKQKISKGKIGKVTKNKGLIHITNGMNNKMVQPENLQEYLDNGWDKGRTHSEETKQKKSCNDTKKKRRKSSTTKN